MKKRIASLWFENLSIERIERRAPIKGPFALTLHQKNAERLYALNRAAWQHGLSAGMGLGDARTLCASLQSAPADLEKDARALRALARFSQRYCPWVGLDEHDGLALDLSGSTHLWGGDAGFLERAKADFAQLGFRVKIGIAGTRGAAWALAHYREGIAEDLQSALRGLPIAALRISGENEVLARRLGLHKIGDLYDKPRAEIARRFGTHLLLRLDQALGEQFENISPIAAPSPFAMRMNFPEPIGMLADVMAGLERLLNPLGAKLMSHGQAMQALWVSLRQVDGQWQHIRIGFARPMHRASEILPLLEPKVKDIDAGFGFDLLRIEAQDLSDWSASYVTGVNSERGVSDLLTKIGNRIGFENIQKLIPCERHLPEASFAYRRFDEPDEGATLVPFNPRPLVMFPPERLASGAAVLPKNFTWRRMKFRVARAIGPERIAPEWWREDEGWRFGLRDYWRVATEEGRRLWLFYTPQNPAWYVQGEFA